MIIFIDIFLL